MNPPILDPEDPRLELNSSEQLHAEFVMRNLLWHLQDEPTVWREMRFKDGKLIDIIHGISLKDELAKMMGEN